MEIPRVLDYPGYSFSKAGSIQVCFDSIKSMSERISEIIENTEKILYNGIQKLVLDYEKRNKETVFGVT